MTLTRPVRGGPVHDSAVERLETARNEQRFLRDAAADARGTPAEDAADDRFHAAADRAAAREAWLIWLERGF